MNKLAGGSLLSCGHYQVLSDHRVKLAAAGLEQKPMWCIECAGWQRVIPAENHDDIVDTSDNDVLQ